MKHPEFTDEEQYAITFCRANQTHHWLRDMAWNDMPYLVPALALAIWGMVQDSALAVLFGFLLLFIFSIRNVFVSDQWGRVYGAIFDKYDACFADDEGDEA